MKRRPAARRQMFAGSQVLSRPTRLGAVVVLSTALLGCASTIPLLPEPRALAPGHVRLQGGAAAMVPVAGDVHVVARAREAAAAGGSGDEVASGAALDLVARTGVAPLVRATAGLAERLEANLRFGGNELAVGGRWVFWEDRTTQGGASTLSIGAEARTLLQSVPRADRLPQVTVRDFAAFGFAVPALWAFRSDGGLIDLWAGALLGWDHLSAQVRLPRGELPNVASGPENATSVERRWAALVVGLSTGFRWLRVATELGVQRDWFEVRVGDRPQGLQTWSLTPAFSLGWTL